MKNKSKILISQTRKSTLNNPHEVITDMALALGMDWFFKSYTNFVAKIGVTPGFDTTRARILSGGSPFRTMSH